MARRLDLEVINRKFARNRVQWRALIPTVMDVRFLLSENLFQ
jgi:hypothetical protein